MNPERKAQWVAALRSGEYKKGITYLKKGGCHCSFGVAAELAVKAGVLKAKEMENEVTLFGYAGNGCTLPLELVDWLGLGDFEDKGRVIWMNDALESSFSDIADWIEKNL